MTVPLQWEVDQTNAGRESVAASTSSHSESVSNGHPLGLPILSAAVALGVLGDALLRHGPEGVGAAIWFVLAVAAMLVLAQWRDEEGARAHGLLAIPVVVFALLLSWRDAEGLRGLNIISLLLALAIWGRSLVSGAQWAAGAGTFRDYVTAAFGAVRAVLMGFVELCFRDLRGARHARFKGSPGLRGVLRGGALALPLVLAFTGLLMAADSVFAGLIRDTIAFDLEELLPHLLLASVFTWIAGGYLRSALLGPMPRLPASEGIAPTLGFAETATVLGALSTLFGSFVLLQATHLFGGAVHVQRTAGLTLAEYARSGFFELCWVAALVVPLLLVTHELLKPGDSRARKAWRIGAAVILALVLLMLGSAMHRMRLYQESYGLTELRVYVTAVIFWIACVLTRLLTLIVRGAAPRVGGFAVLAGWGTVLALNVLDPDALIVRVNERVAGAGDRSPDREYVGMLSADAVPANLHRIGSRPSEEDCRYLYMIEQRLRWEADWRVQNVGRVRARRALGNAGVASAAAACSRMSPSRPGVKGWTPQASASFGRLARRARPARLP